MRSIDRISADPSRPYANLLPLVDFLTGLGNFALDGGFILNPDGWRCRLRDRIDFEAVRSEFNFPANVTLSEEHDTILDSLSWCSIEGPAAHG